MKRPSPGTVLGSLALVVALGGTGYSVSQLPRNSVGTAQIKAGAVTGAKVRKGSLTADRLAPGVLAAAGSSAAGPTGPQGPAGPAGPTGPAGAAGSARAYGQVSATGVLTVARSRGVDHVTRNGTGYYCIILDDAISASNPVVVATIDYAASSTMMGFSQPAGIEPEFGDNSCGAGRGVSVATYTLGVNAVTAQHDEGFFFVVP